MCILCAYVCACVCVGVFAAHHTGSAYSLDSMHSHVRSSPHDELLTPMSPRSSRRVLVGGNRRPQVLHVDTFACWLLVCR